MTLQITEVTARELPNTDATAAHIQIAGVQLQVVIGSDGQVAVIHRQASGALETVVVSQDGGEIEPDVLTALVRLGREKK